MEQQHRRCFAPTTTGHRAVGLEEEDVDALYIIDEKDSFCEDVIKIHLKKEKEARKRTRRRHRLLRLGLLKRTNEVRVH